MVANSQVCNASNASTQLLSVQASGDINITNVSLSASNTISTKCLAELENSATLTTQIANELKSQIENQTKQQMATAISSQNSTSQNTLIQALQDIKANFDMSNVSSCIANNTAVQQVILQAGGNATINNLKYQIDQALVTDCILRASNTATSLATISNELAASAANSTTQGSDFSSIILLVLIIFGVLGFFALGGLRVVKGVIKGTGKTVGAVASGTGSLLKGTAEVAGNTVGSIAKGVSGN